MRIVSLVPSLTELLHDLGLDEEVVGVTTFCVRPEGWNRSKVRVGGTKTVKRDKLAALGPDLVLANQEENVKADVEWIAQRFPTHVTNVATLGQALEMIRTVGALVEKDSRAARIATQVAAGFEGLGELPARRAAYLIWREPWMVAGGDTFIGDVMRHGGLVNPFEERARYPAVSAEELRAAAPELLLLSSEPFPFKERHADELREAVPEARALFVDGELFSWYGSRLLLTPAYLKELAERRG